MTGPIEPAEFDVSRFMDGLRAEIAAIRPKRDFRIARKPPALARASRKNRRKSRISSRDLGPVRARASLGELLRYDGAEFLQQAYTKLLGRRCDPSGLANFLPQLRGSWLDKVAILQALRASPEGQKRDIRIRGLEAAILWRKLVRGRRVLSLAGGRAFGRAKLRADRPAPGQAPNLQPGTNVNTAAPGMTGGTG